MNLYQVTIGILIRVFVYKGGIFHFVAHSCLLTYHSSSSSLFFFFFFFFNYYYYLRSLLVSEKEISHCQNPIPISQKYICPHRYQNKYRIFRQ